MFFNIGNYTWQCLEFNNVIGSPGIIVNRVGKVFFSPFLVSGYLTFSRVYSFGYPYPEL